MNIQIYSNATLCTERISEYIQMPHIYRMNILIYFYGRNSTNTNTNNINYPKIYECISVHIGTGKMALIQI